MREIGRVESIGQTACELLARRNFVGRVLAIVTGAVYLSVSASREAAKQSPNWNVEIAASHKPLLAMTCEDREILWLTQNNMPMHTRAIRGDFNFAALSVGMKFQSDGAALQFDHRFAAQFADARTWRPESIVLTRIAPLEIVMDRAQKLLDLTGFRAGEPVRSLHALIGLGAGLTPSGDDFVGGMLFAQWHLHRTYPGSAQWDQRAVDALIEFARTRTDLISYAILRDHARGQSVEPLHDLMAALVQAKESDQVDASIRRLVTIGSTSGCDMLAGALVGMLSLRVDAPVKTRYNIVG